MYHRDGGESFQGYPSLLHRNQQRCLVSHSVLSHHANRTTSTVWIANNCAFLTALVEDDSDGSASEEEIQPRAKTAKKMEDEDAEDNENEEGEEGEEEAEM